MSKEEGIKYIRIECVRIACAILGVSSSGSYLAEQKPTTDQVLEKSKQIFQWVNKSK